MSKVKKIKLEIELVNFDGIDDLLEEIKLNLMAGNKAFKKRIGDLKCSYTLNYELPYNYREEMINGVWCQIFQSKMNLKG